VATAERSGLIPPARAFPPSQLISPDVKHGTGRELPGRVGISGYFDFAAIFVSCEPLFCSNIGHISKKRGDAGGAKSAERGCEHLC
jgi:hypothetical protein